MYNLKKLGMLWAFAYITVLIEYHAVDTKPQIDDLVDAFDLEGITCPRDIQTEIEGGECIYTDEWDFRMDFGRASEFYDVHDDESLKLRAQDSQNVYEQSLAHDEWLAEHEECVRGEDFFG